MERFNRCIEESDFYVVNWVLLMRTRSLVIVTVELVALGASGFSKGKTYGSKNVMLT